MTDPNTLSSIADTHDQIILALIALVGTSIAVLAWVIRNGRWVKDGARAAVAANAAVNHVEFGERRLYEIVTHIEAKQDEFDRRWGNLPETMGNAVALTELLHDMSKRIDRIEGAIADHVRWEESVKWPAITREATP